MVNTNEEHGPDCTCGCHDHGHEGERGHHHEHGGHHREHNHAHEHAHKRKVELGWGTAALESHTHEQAATVSATICAQSNSSTTFARLVEALQAVARQVESAGGIVGHIKAYAKLGDSFAHASATDAQHAPSCEGVLDLPLNPETHCQLVAIALLVDLEQLEQIVIGALR